MSSWDADDVQVRCVVLERIVDVADVLLLRDCRLHRQLPHLRHYGKGAHSHTRLYRERREREVMFFFFFLPIKRRLKSVCILVTARVGLELADGIVGRTDRLRRLPRGRVQHLADPSLHRHRCARGPRRRGLQLREPARQPPAEKERHSPRESVRGNLIRFVCSLCLSVDACISLSTFLYIQE